MQLRVAIVGILLSLVGLIIFISSTQAMKTEDLPSSAFLLVTGVFLGMAGLLVLFLQMFSHPSAAK